MRWFQVGNIHNERITFLITLLPQFNLCFCIHVLGTYPTYGIIWINIFLCIFLLIYILIDILDAIFDTIILVSQNYQIPNLQINKPRNPPSYFPTNILQAQAAMGSIIYWEFNLSLALGLGLSTYFDLVRFFVSIDSRTWNRMASYLKLELGSDSKKTPQLKYKESFETLVNRE